jgi:hypothetical protein
LRHVRATPLFAAIGGAAQATDGSASVDQPAGWLHGFGHDVDNSCGIHRRRLFEQQGRDSTHMRRRERIAGKKRIL